MSHHRPPTHPALRSLVGAALLAIPVGEQATAPVGELTRLSASLSGELQVGDIPVSSGINIDALKKGDADPLEIVVEVPAGRSKRGWDYRPEALQRIVGEVMKQGLPGFLGHQKAEDVDTQFPTPVTHWVGAKFENGKAYFRGVVDASASDLKRWIRAKAIQQVSIFGRPALQRAGGEIRVVDYDPLSIDWTPLHRAGMPTSIVALAGEMDSITGVGGGAGSTSTNPRSAAGAAAPPRSSKRMDIDELLAELRKGKATPAQVLGEMGWQPKDVLSALGLDLAGAATALSGEQATLWGALQAGHAALGEIATALGLTDPKPVDVVTAVKAVHAAQQAAAAAARTATVERVIGEMVSAEPVRPVVRELVLPKLASNADEAAIKAAVGEVTALDHIKTLIGANFGGGRPISPVQSGGASSSTGSAGGAGAQGTGGGAGGGFAAGLRVRSAAI